MDDYTIEGSSSTRGPLRVADADWLYSTVPLWESVVAKPPRKLSLNLRNTNWVNLSEWVSTAAILARVLRQRKTSLVEISFAGPDDFLTQADPAEATRRQAAAAVTDFLEAVGTRAFLLRHDPELQVVYPFQRTRRIEKSPKYRGKQDPSVILALSGVTSADDCRLYLDTEQLRRWRGAMANRFPESPLFDQEELWRVLCHELAANIFEHAGAPGVLAARVVSDPGRDWARVALGSHMDALASGNHGPLLELCVSDAGQGIFGSLEKSYRRRFRLSESVNIPAEDVVIYALDGRGSCKDQSESWASERHALGRVLRIVWKYGGGLRVRSGTVEIVYLATGEPKRWPTGFGFEPSYINRQRPSVPGTHFQLVLPVIPRTAPNARSTARLRRPLPSTFYTQPEQPKGHLVPLLERLGTFASIGREQQRTFRDSCEHLIRELQLRSPDEPIVFDFSELEWSAGQFETFLYFLQGLLQSRPCLLVDVPTVLALEVQRLEQDSAPTLLSAEAKPTSTGASGTVFGEITEVSFNEAYTQVHCTVLGLDRDGSLRIFGLPDSRYEPLLLDLRHTPSTHESIEAAHKGETWFKSAVLHLLLSSVNPLFESDEHGLWRMVWDEESLAVQRTRSLTKHITEVLERSGAWLGGWIQRETRFPKPPIFFLPWIGEWRSDFLCASQVLSRGRQADEIAQRLIFRLQLHLEAHGRDLSVVRGLACATAPSMLLATAIHRWWPQSADEPPAIIDLGHYLIHAAHGRIPRVLSGGDTVMIQDVLDTGRQQAQMLQTLVASGARPIAVLGFARLSDSEITVRATDPQEVSWELSGTQIPTHSLIVAPRPKPVQSPSDTDTDDHAYWIEPRSLRAVRYPTLRREFQRGRDPDLDRRDVVLRELDDPSCGCALAAGHYVYGRRHFGVVVDVQKVVQSPIAARLVEWIADICTGIAKPRPEAWERSRRTNLAGDVSAVLMPLQSQIHYLWPHIEKELARRGRRQPMWLLEASFFTGRGPEYDVPSQLQFQLEEAIRAVSSGEPAARKLRFLILDDAAVTGRTAETIVSTLIREARKAYRRVGLPYQEDAFPIQWIRHFVLFNQMDYPQYHLWGSQTQIGEMKVPYAFESLAPFMGMPVYDGDNCPHCISLARNERANAHSLAVAVAGTREWLSERVEELRPIAADGPLLRIKSPAALAAPLQLIDRSRATAGAEPYRPRHADTAIWRFHELMYLSYPPGDVLRTLKRADAGNDDPEMSRFRWAVLDWCFRHWPRVKADGSMEDLLQACETEINGEGKLLFRIMEGLAIRAEEPRVQSFLRRVIEIRTALEATNRPEDQDQLLRLGCAVAVFFSHLPPANERLYHALVDLVGEFANRRPPGRLSFAHTLHHQLSRKDGFADPYWALETMAETVFRGRHPEYRPYGHHFLLPRLVRDARNGLITRSELALLYEGVVWLRVALQDLSHHFDFADDGATLELLDAVRESLDGRWASDSPPLNLSLLGRLHDLLDFGSEFMGRCQDLFHRDVADLCRRLVQEQTSPDSVVFSFDVSRVQGAAVLTDLFHLRQLLANLCVDRKSGPSIKSRIEVTPSEKPNRLSFRIVNDRGTPQEASEYWLKSVSCGMHKSLLTRFGVVFDESWSEPSKNEAALGFTCAFQIDVPAGFMQASEK